jgi:membrane-associated phospholipid phosphatase
MKSFTLYIFILFCPYFAFAQNRDTLDLQPKGSIKPFIIPAAFIGYGAISLMGNNPIRKLDLRVSDEIKTHSSRFFTRTDDYLRYVPAAAVYALHLAGVKGKHTVADATGIYLLTTAISGTVVISSKHMTNRTRPDGSDSHSFPSGHSTTAFASAEFLYQEYKDVSPWYGYAGYTIATTTAVLRLYNKKHWLSDVVAGAGIGILSAKASYLLYPKIKQVFGGKKTSNYSIVPLYQQRTFGFAYTTNL